jgi:hypothetical protein
MVQGRKRLGFAFKARKSLRIGVEGLRQYFDRDIASKVRVRGAVHLAHAAGTQGILDLIRSKAHTGARGMGCQIVEADFIEFEARPTRLLH